MSRPFSATTPQHAPCSWAARQAALSGAKTAFTSDQPNKGGTSQTRMAKVSKVASELPQPSKKFCRSQATTPCCEVGGGRLATGAKTTPDMVQRSLIAERRL